MSVRHRFRRPTVGVYRPHASILKICKQRGRIDARDFARPYDLGVINISPIENPFGMDIVVRRVMHNHQLFAGHLFKPGFHRRAIAKPALLVLRRMKGSQNQHG